MTLEGKRLLVLGGASQCIKVVKAAKALGIYTIVVDINPNAAAKKYADESLNLSLLEPEAILAWCRENPIDGVINICVDAAQKTRYYLCDKLGLPNYGTPTNLTVLTDKNEFKNVCRQYGVDVVPEYSVEDLEAGRAQYPVFVKPAECSGSRGVSVCRGPEELTAAMELAKKNSRNGEVIIEHYFDMPYEFMVTYIFVDGKPYLERTSDRYTGLAADNLDKVSALAVSPSNYTELFLDKVNDNLISMFKGIGVQNGPVFAQGFINGDTICFFDPAMRLPGANYELMLKEATGIDVMKMLIEYSLTGKMDEEEMAGLSEAYRLNGKYSAIVFPVLRPGTIDRIEGFEEIRELPMVLGVYEKHKPGDTVKNNGDISRRVAEIDMLFDSKEEMVRGIQTMRDTLKVIDTDGRDMITSNTDLNLL